MCGRFSLRSKPAEVATLFRLPNIPDLAPRYNVAPSDPIAVVGLKPDGVTRGLAMLTWGLVPHDSLGEKPKVYPIARAESVAVKQSFADSFRHRRCLIPTDGFYEWRLEGGKKRGYHVRMSDGRPFALAAIWDRWDGPDGMLRSCAIITAEPNDVVRPYKDRMPCVLDPEQFEVWLDPKTKELERPLSLLRPYPADRMMAVAVGSFVNSSRNQGPNCLEPVA